ncbi:MAG: hypothetical protein QOG04_660 [Actinomycetota bacterium]|nr:hypothetical protein [Actinomycetota bacterium]
MTKLSVRSIVVVTCLLAAMGLTAAPALADLDAGAGSVQDSIKAPISDHDGDADSDSGTGYTEDNDTNDGGTPNNQADEGDNKHPSGKDRSVENGKSGNQGKSESDPDGDENGGKDKPNGSGGEDLADQDGNNGCGNDDDFEDDNNGNCGGHKKAKTVDSCSEGDEHGHGWECSEGSGGSTPPPSPGPSPSGCPNKHMGGDDNGHGANQSGAYDSTCDGSPSGNGNGGGSAKGKPCAGCVGNADDKNPPGQAPDGSDHNKGYECDENSGVGRTNPAHSGCKPPSTDVCPAGTDMAGLPPGTTGCEIPETEVCPAGTDMAGLPPGTEGCNKPDEVKGGQAKLCPAGTDRAGKVMKEGDDCDEPTSVLGKVLQSAGPLGTAVKKTASVLGAALPFTGAGDLLAFLVLAVGLIAGGLVLLKKKSA